MAMTRRPLTDRTIMIVEDEYFLADDLKKLLRARGAAIIGPFSTIANAKTALKSGKPDCAILDINIQGEFAFQLARDLQHSEIPVIFVSGYDVSVFPTDLHHFARLEKPVNAALLVDLVEKAMRRQLSPGDHSFAS